MPSALSPSPRRLGSINWLGLWTLYLKEVRRFSKVATQTIVSPLVTTLLYLVIFSLALGRSLPQLGGVSYAQFLMPGLIMMSMAQNAFANTSSSLVISKVQGNIVDLLMPPLSAAELTLGLAAGGLSRGLAVGFTSAVILRILMPFSVHDWLFVLFSAVAALLLTSALVSSSQAQLGVPNANNSTLPAFVTTTATGTPSTRATRRCVPCTRRRRGYRPGTTTRPRTTTPT